MFASEQESWLPLINGKFLIIRKLYSYGIIVLGIMIASDRKAVALERIAAFAKRVSTLAMHTYPHLSISLLYPAMSVLTISPFFIDKWLNTLFVLFLHDFRRSSNY